MVGWLICHSLIENALLCLTSSTQFVLEIFLLPIQGWKKWDWHRKDQCIFVYINKNTNWCTRTIQNCVTVTEMITLPYMRKIFLWLQNLAEKLAVVLVVQAQKVNWFLLSILEVSVLIGFQVEVEHTKPCILLLGFTVPFTNHCM